MMKMEYKEQIWLNLLPLKKEWDVMMVGDETSLSSNLLSNSVKKLIISNFEKLSFDENSFDLIILCEAERLNKNEQNIVIQKAKKIMKSSGIFVVIATKFHPFRSYKYENLLQSKFKVVNVLGIFPSYKDQIFAFSLNKKTIYKASKKLLERRYSIKSIMGSAFLNIIAFVKLYRFHFMPTMLFFAYDKPDNMLLTSKEVKKDIVLIKGGSRNNICILNEKKIFKIPKIQTKNTSISTEFKTIKNLEKLNIPNIPNQKLERRGDTFLLLSDYYGDPLLSAHDIRFSKLNKKGINEKLIEIMNWLINKYQIKMFNGEFERLEINSANIQLESCFDDYKKGYILPFGKIHGDFIYKNILYADNGKFVVIDFENNREDFLLFDLIYFYMYLFARLHDYHKIKDNFFEILNKKADNLFNTYTKTIKMFAEEYGLDYKILSSKIIPFYILCNIGKMEGGITNRVVKKLAMDHLEYFKRQL